MDFNVNKEKYDINDLLEVMKILRSENGCPWDREQTHKSIRADLIEETYEVVEAIDNDDPALLREELGDLLLQCEDLAFLLFEQGCLLLDFFRINGDLFRGDEGGIEMPFLVVRAIAAVQPADEFKQAFE